LQQLLTVSGQALHLAQLELFQATILACKLCKINKSTTTAHHETETPCLDLSDADVKPTPTKPVDVTWLGIVSGSASSNAVEVFGNDHSSSNQLLNKGASNSINSCQFRLADD